MHDKSKVTIALLCTKHNQPPPPSTTVLCWSHHLQCWYHDYKMESQCTCVFFGHDTKHLSCKFFGRKQWYQSGQQRAKKLHFPKWTAKSSGKTFCCLCSRSSSWFSWPKKLKKLQQPTRLSKIGTSAFRLWLLPLKLDYQLSLCGFPHFFLLLKTIVVLHDTAHCSIWSASRGGVTRLGMLPYKEMQRRQLVATFERSLREQEIFKSQQ